MSKIVFKSGGSKGFSSVIWTVEDFEEDSHLTLTYDSFDGEQGTHHAIFAGDDIQNDSLLCCVVTVLFLLYALCWFL